MLIAPSVEIVSRRSEKMVVRNTLRNKPEPLKKERLSCQYYLSKRLRASAPKKKSNDAKITEAVDEAYQIGDTLIFLREYPVENVAMDGRIQSENPKILEALKKINAGA